MPIHRASQVEPSHKLERAASKTNRSADEDVGSTIAPADLRGREIEREIFRQAKVNGAALVRAEHISRGRILLLQEHAFDRAGLAGGRVQKSAAELAKGMLTVSASLFGLGAATTTLLSVLSDTLFVSGAMRLPPSSRTMALLKFSAGLLDGE